ncbi:MAG: acyl-CoA dehydratase activase-related protein [Promethearchaeota archaeon]|jgi:predicted nucleotide-binding protein (sugar kinase/HSP70/actin superfamily)
MILSFPNMGPSVIAFKTLFEQLDIKVVLPDPTNREAIKIGVKYSPEFVCFPFKSTLGDFVSAINKGADTLVMAIDCGPCRFGFYHAVQERLLHDMGYKDVNIIPLDQADLLTFNWVKALQEFLKKAKLLNDIQTAEGLFRAYERNQGDTTEVLNNILNKLDQANTLKELRNFKKVIKEDFNKIDVDKTKVPLKVTLSGEIHISLEPFVNVDIRRKLGEMGVEIHQFLSLYDWVVHKFHLNYHRKWLEHLAKPYMPMDIGGEAIWVIGSYIHAAQSGMLGFVHSYPFTCMPEVTARTIITNKLKKKYDLPIIYFSFDEHSGQEGMRTRLEAFVDLMESRRKHKLSIENISLQEHNKNFYKSNGSHFFQECVQLLRT